MKEAKKFLKHLMEIEECKKEAYYAEGNSNFKNLSDVELKTLIEEE